MNLAAVKSKSLPITLGAGWLVTLLAVYWSVAGEKATALSDIKRHGVEIETLRAVDERIIAKAFASELALAEFRSSMEKDMSWIRAAIERMEQREPRGGIRIGP